MCMCVCVCVCTYICYTCIHHSTSLCLRRVQHTDHNRTKPTIKFCSDFRNQQAS